MPWNPTSIDELFELYETLGDRSYGESITQNEHALQCAALARDAGASDALIVAALFHDVGHLALDVQGESRASTSRVDDDDHEARGARILAPTLRSASGPAGRAARDRQALALHARAGVPRPTLASITGHADRPGWTLERRRSVSASNVTPASTTPSPFARGTTPARSRDSTVGALRDWEPLVRSLAETR